MMIILNKQDYSVVKKKITVKENSPPTFALSVLDEYINGTVYADSVNLQTILIGTNSGIYYVFGNESNDQFNKDFIEFYRKRSNDNLRFTLFSANTNWDQALIKHLKNELKQIRRLAFTHKNNVRLHTTNTSSENFSIKKIDEKTITNSVEFNNDYYKEYWGSVTNFIENGFGFCILHQGKVVSECTSIFSSKSLIEIDIATQSDFQGFGLATKIGKEFINYSSQKNLIPRWDCDVSNRSSINLAEKLGFTNPKEYTVFVNNFHDE
ncbi:RimJ/RimL family protein N-acetyltransferase [Metabacillus crassostreae]|uniref:GNAT family N-acetyltransferase n=1 Tax=Metabacillus crassostreae TaxID=929098 RepID=UPI00195B7F97|nr:GNAT family N-acetyltransferase [Metabacillus crassostreae]MBM7602962.1 RimJ/RimL family protein N-acetyltransferase [Metabacillus crassostreae]